MAVSYRRNRNYKNQFKWTNELNEDLYKCYMSAKSDPKIGYINRMKKLWNEKHPELNFFSAKNLRDQASREEKNKVIMETEYRIDKKQNNINAVNNDTTEENSHLKFEHLAINNKSIGCDTEVQTVKNPVPKVNTSINETIKDIFM